MQVRKQQLELDDWFQIGKGVHQGCILSPCLFNFYAEYIMRNAALEETQAEIKIAWRTMDEGLFEVRTISSTCHPAYLTYMQSTS